ncbi:succinylglutamate desuccinylase/aspartoacylase family protein [Microvirga antarctica]|uniref:succinylglutamate desuccinylase/aspartoacylase family protein n=1 Tax=Microvirga antarctica TaxID=2819233 RepID=UPI001B31134F|nr:succinylglutamate desuccinylase/aspartoacylase family protein [Microvirga antarctica]
MSKEIIVGTAHSKGAGVTKGVLKIADAPDGSPLNAPVVIVQGEQDGPVVWMHGCVHGNEYCGTYIIHDFVRSLDPATLKGTVVALPILNVSAFQTKRRMSPYEGYNGGDLNRQFPGDQGGTITQQMAYALYEPLKKYADVLIDFHTALTPDVRWALFPQVDGKAGEMSEKVARAFGYRDTLPAPDSILAGSAMMTAAKAGIASFIVECGGKIRAFTDESVADAVDRLHNVLRVLGMEEGAVKDYGTMNFFSNFEWVTATDGGLFERRVLCGDTVEEGTVIGQYYDMFGNARAEAKSPAAGIVLAIHPGPVMATGETLIHIGLNPRAA